MKNELVVTSGEKKERGFIGLGMRYKLLDVR